MALGVEKLISELGQQLAIKLGLVKTRKLSKYAKSVPNPLPVLRPTKAGRRVKRNL